MEFPQNCFRCGYPIAHHYPAFLKLKDEIMGETQEEQTKKIRAFYEEHNIIRICCKTVLVSLTPIDEIYINIFMNSTQGDIKENETLLI